MRLIGWLATAAWLAGCSGDGPVQRPDPEICDDGIDNDGDGLVDCDDGDDCGGLACVTHGDDDDTVTEPPEVEIVLDEDLCTGADCTFDYAGSDCPQKELGTFHVFNRTDDTDAEFQIYCNGVGPDGARVIQWKADGGQLRPTLANVIIAPGDSLEVTAAFVCAAGINQSFDTFCNAYVNAEPYDQDLDFEMHGNTASGTP
ncbi:MAG: hypothetical protein R3F59_04755 [Myxococcota bacterium]